MKMKKETKIKRFAEILAELYPQANCSLEYDGSPWKLLVCARLSAQCTDERVNIVAKDLFQTFPTPQAMANAPEEQIQALIKSCGLYKGKAKSIKESSRIIVEKFGGNVPNTMQELLSLPGVGRKIANLILGDVYGKGGIVADTHCMRISCRLGLCEKKDPLHVERTLTPLVPKSQQSALCHRLVLFGREICKAQNPQCSDCPAKKAKICDFTPQK